MTKRATHFQPSTGSELRLRMCDHGGFMVSTGGRDYECAQTAAFSTADECAEWVRSFLKNAADRTFGAQKPPR